MCPVWGKLKTFHSKFEWQMDGGANGRVDERTAEGYWGKIHLASAVNEIFICSAGQSFPSSLLCVLRATREFAAGLMASRKLFHIIAIEIFNIN